ncbi:type 1 periplasmic-binding domain-containing protein [Candidatus Solirubrobacter pratensis]|uniref:hypothetical protein n=1 Tax=Candidatus Solirubrobacter pratensis TaxID=1298857 RepID=UPI00041C5D48|nr:hypothetical protein [Candidatus Solirubrobacter pratensis]
MCGSRRRAGGSRSPDSPGWRAEARGYAALARRVRDARAGAVYLAGLASNHGPRLLADLRRTLSSHVPIIRPDGFAAPGYLIEGAGAAAEGFVFTIATLPSNKLPPAGHRFATEFDRRFGAFPCCVAMQSAQAMYLLLDAIAASDGSRADVTRHVLRSGIHTSIAHWSQSSLARGLAPLPRSASTVIRSS